MDKCEKCGKEIKNDSQLCVDCEPKNEESNDENFSKSLILGIGTNNAILGSILGGDITGGIIGDASISGGII